MTRNELVASVHSEKCVNITQKFKETVGNTQDDLFKFQRFLYHIMYDPKLITVHKKTSKGESKRVHWKRSREYGYNTFFEIDENKDSDLYKTLHMFKNYEKYYKFFKYMIVRASAEWVKIPSSRYRYNSGVSDYVNYYMIMGSTYIEFEFGDLNFARYFKVFASYNYGTLEEEDK